MMNLDSLEERTVLEKLPHDAREFMHQGWEAAAPAYQELQGQSIGVDNVQAWLTDWSRIRALVEEAYWRLYVAKTLDTTNEKAQMEFERYLEKVYRPAESVDQELKIKLLESGLEPDGYSVQLRRFQAEREIFKEENQALLTEHERLDSEYDRVVGAQTVEWEGEELTLPQLRPLLKHPNREQRASIWTLAANRSLQDRERINEIWQQLMQVRKQIATNADLPNYRSYRWKKLHRFDYSPDNCKQFHEAIELTAVPAARRILERKARALGLEVLQPWDTEVDPQGREPLEPFDNADQLIAGAGDIFAELDPELSAHFQTMLQENLLDLDNRKGKAPGGYCTSFHTAKRPFIFMNAVGIHDDVQTMLHEAGHAFHVFEGSDLDFWQRYKTPMEFNEVASMAMELLAAPYLSSEKGGFYTEKEAARAQIEHLEDMIRFWPYMAVVDAFQHWAYENDQEGMDPTQCDAKWSELWDRFMLGVDWSGYQDAKETGWHRKLHLYEVPFYYVEYGLAQLGAAQIWLNAKEDHAQALSQYRQALTMGATVPLPDLYAIAGARFAFDADSLGTVVDRVEQEIEALEAV
jgi:oligoendopeptidase F